MTQRKWPFESSILFLGTLDFLRITKIPYTKDGEVDVDAHLGKCVKI